MSTSSSNSVLQYVKNKLQSESPWFRKLSKAVWIVFLCAIVGIPAYIISVRVNLFGLFGEMPSLRAIENPTNDLSSELISADGASLARYFTFNRSQVTFKQLSPDLVKTLVISEDHRFYDHSGLDFQAYLRVLKGLITLDISGHGGGSTLTQQLAKNLFTINPELDGTIGEMGGMPRRIIQKTKEWMIAIDLERNFTKEEIIAMYLNTCNFSHNAYGIKVASETYFGKRPALLNLQESAVLVGMLQNPSLFNPHSRPKNALTKRNEVITKLYRSGYIKSKSSYDSLMALPIEMKFSVQDQNEGIAPYLRSALQREL
jgi:penicillin-binding protein 1A